MHTGIGRAIEAAGGQGKLAEVLGVSQQFVSVCYKRGWVPVDRAVEIEALFGVPRRETINPRLASLLDEPMSGI
jgi:DNA-binding transcriptional regulator YdaS (Cro superfamily)